MEQKSFTYSCFVFMIYIKLTCAVPIVNTVNGKILGLKTIHDNEPVFNFLKVPYAKPPVGDLRFRKPVKTGNWTGILNTTSYGPSCYQRYTSYTDIKYVPNNNISEDCLFLNIYVPRKLTPKSNLAVMVYIHGGSYYLGQGMRYDGWYLALRGHVIVVTINYRLGVFGFLSTGDSVSPGNYGLWDQRLAIQWVKNNILAFGGNPNSITLFGQSAGGFCVTLQSIIPKNKGLFQRIISQSGIANSPIAIPDTEIAVNLTVEIANATGCLDDITVNWNTTYMVECLRGINSSYLENTFYWAYGNSYSPRINLALDMAPVVDGELITDHPSRLLSDKMSASYKFFRSLDVIIGTTNGEGSILYTYLFGLLTKFYLNDMLSCNGMCTNLAPTMTKELYSNSSAVSTAICNKYKVPRCTKSVTGHQRRQVMNLYGDALFVSPAIEALRIHAESNNKTKTYQYIFTRPSSSGIGQRPKWFHGAPHASELLYLFPDKKAVLKNAADKVLRENMVDYWSTFATYGNPNSKGVPNWSPFFPNQSCQVIDYNITSGDQLYKDRVDFWTITVPSLQREGLPSNMSLPIHIYSNGCRFQSCIYLLFLILLVNMHLA